MKKSLIHEEQYRQGADVVNFVAYRSTTGVGEDHVLQHKLLGTTETAHVTLHPDGTVNLRVKRTPTFLVAAIKSNLAGVTPALSPQLKSFLAKVRDRIEVKAVE